MLRMVAAIVLLIGVLPNAYPFYILLRVVVCGVCAYTAYGYAQTANEKLTWLFGAIAVLFNPLLPVYLTRELWFPIDIATAILLFWSVFRDRRAKAA
jgi:hypothetical protein